jgi:hypothetical protein
MELQPLIAAYGRDRRVALRIERMPSRSRLTRGRNNGDGSWSLTRDELDDLCYLPPKGASEMPTLVVRIIGLDSDNGATLAVHDHPVLREPEQASSETEADAAPQNEAELRNLRAELAKMRATLKATQSDLTAARKSWDTELEQRLNEAADEAVATLEERRSVWMTETKERLLKSEARGLERLEQARERWRRDTETELAKAEEIWKSSEAMRLADAEAHWQEQSARALSKEAAQLKQLEAALAASRALAHSNASDGSEILQLRETNAGLQASLTEAQHTVEQIREQVRTEAAAALAGAERSWKAEETKRLAAAEEKWRDETARALETETNKRTELEATLAETRAQAAAGEAGNAEIERLHREATGLATALAERETKSEEERAAGLRAREEDALAAAAALAGAEQAWKAAEDERLKSAESAWQEQVTRKTKEMAARLAQAEAALAEVNSGRERRETAETRRLRAELSVLRETQDETGQRIAQIEAAAAAARDDAETSRTALATAEEAWKKDEAVRFAAAEARWQEQSARVLAEVTEKLERAKSTVAELRAGAKNTRERPDQAEIRRLNAELAQAKAEISERQIALEAALDGARTGGQSARREFEHALAEAKKAWEAEEASRLIEAKTQWKEQSDRLFKKATVRLEGAEAALADARTEANTARDRRDSAELRRLRSEFAAMRAQLAEREAGLAEAQVAAGRSRERTREEVESALLKAEETWKSGEQLRIAEIETRERERGARALSEAVARLERTEAALTEARAQVDAERERAAVAAAEAAARQDRSESALQESRNRIETLRDPANESELARLRTELAALQVAQADREAEIAQTRAAARKSRESWAERTQASVQRAEHLWRNEEAQRLAAARREWQRDARLSGLYDIESKPEPAELRKANRLALDSALAVALAAVVVLGITFYPRLQPYLPGLPGSYAAEPPRTAAPVHFHRAAAAPAPKPHALIGIARARLRNDPSMRGMIVETLARGASVETAGQRAGWVHVRVAATDSAPAREGWVRATSLTPLSPK